MLFFQREEFDWLFVRFAMDADIGNRLHPVACGAVKRVQAGRQFQAGEEVFLYVPDTAFDSAFFVGFAHIAGPWFEAVVSSEVEISRMKERPFPDGMMQHSRLKVVDEHFGRNTAKELEGVLVSGQEVLRCFAQGKLDVAQPAVTEHHDKEREPSAS